MWDVLQWVPLGIVVSCTIGLFMGLKVESRKFDKYWEEEETRQQRVKKLYPAAPSYEERMGVQYGPKQNE